MSNIFFETSFLEYPDKESISVVASFSGCPHHCDGCHSPISQKFEQENVEEYKKQDIKYQTYYSIDSDDFIDLVKKLCFRNNTNKVVLTGGDPLCHYNIDVVRDFIIESGNLELCIYTGYKAECVRDLLLDYPLDNIIFKCGTFHKDEYMEPVKSDEYMQLASTNQNFYKIKNNQITKISEKGKLIF